MNIQMLSNNKELITSLKSILIGKGGFLQIGDNLDTVFENSIQNPSNVFFIQENCLDLANTLDFIKDLRSFFGAFPLIFVIQEKNSQIDLSSYLNVGVDYVLKTPLDTGLLEDYIGDNIQRENFLPLRYRNVPSGGIAAQVNRTITVTEINSEGIIFKSNDFYSRGMIFRMNLGQLINENLPQVNLKVITTTYLDEEEIFNYECEYFELDIEIKRLIRFQLKQARN